MLKLNLIFSLFLCSMLFSVSAQEEIANSKPESKVISESNSKSNSNEATYDKVLEARLDNFKSDQQETMKALDMLEPEQKERLMEAIKSGDQKKVEQLMKEVTLSATKNPEGIQKLIKYSLKQFRDQSPSEVRSQLVGRVEGTVFAPLVAAVPRLVDFFVNLLRDPFALPEFFKIAANRTRLLIFLGINILLFITKWLIKKKEKNKKAPFSERISRFIFFLGLRFVLIGVFFHKELWPMVLVAKRTFS